MIDRLFTLKSTGESKD